jgi:hypothetical protein
LQGITPNTTINQRKKKNNGKIQEIKVKQFFVIYQKSLRLEIADFGT